MLFEGKPGQWRIRAGEYTLMRTRTRRIIRSSQSIFSGEHVTMGMIIPELASDGKNCLFPSCGAFLPDVKGLILNPRLWYL